MNAAERKNDIIKIIEGLDITPGMYENAVQKYESITNYLETNGYDADIYPQGSFALGTVIRPVAKDRSKGYDLDFVYQLSGTRDTTTAQTVRDKAERILTDSELYGGKLLVDDRCFTIEYEDIDGAGFKIDIVPAAAESNEHIKTLSVKSKNSFLLNTSIVIPEKGGETYDWITSNPKGYKQWFDGINQPYKEYKRFQRREEIYKEARHIYASVEAIPEGLERSPLQRVIQILKYHRDVYYSKLSSGDKLRPTSAIITTIAAQIAGTAQGGMDVFELLEYMLNELEFYSEYQSLTEDSFVRKHGMKTVITKRSDGWRIENPANPEDNLADAWNNNGEAAAVFFRWATSVSSDLLKSLLESDMSFRTSMEGAFGSEVVRKHWKDKYQLKAEPRILYPSSQAKPWRLN